MTGVELKVRGVVGLAIIWVPSECGITGPSVPNGCTKAHNRAVSVAAKASFFYHACVDRIFGGSSVEYVDMKR
jgi:hypothetical protein